MMPLMWIWMRQCAYARHVMLWATVDGADIEKWPAHERMIKGFYGF
jgi:hypothetical protein